MRSNVSSVPVPLDDKYSWQILRGKDGTHATAWALRAAQVGSLFYSTSSLYHPLPFTICDTTSLSGPPAESALPL
jgi:hypothetical protein